MGELRGKRANGRHPTGSVSRACCQRLAHTHTVTHTATHTLCVSAPPLSLKESPIYPCRVDHIHQASATHPDQSASRSAPVLLGCLFFFCRWIIASRGGEREIIWGRKIM